VPGDVVEATLAGVDDPQVGTFRKRVEDDAATPDLIR
jgi:hypothetical protein